MTTHLFTGYTEVLMDSFLALLPLLVILAVSQVVFLKFPGRRLLRLLIGILLAFVGLTLFLQGVNIGYIPVGATMGYELAGLSYNWILLPAGFLMGFAVTLAEPAVYVLTQEIEKVSSGSIRRRLLLLSLSIGVAISIALAMLKLLLGISLWYFIIPGYIIAFILARFVDPDFVSIAFDSGGVATGTMTATFVLSLAIGVATRLDHTDPLLDGFGIISIVALTPILMVLILGFLAGRSGSNAGA